VVLELLLGVDGAGVLLLEVVGSDALLLVVYGRALLLEGVSKGSYTITGAWSISAPEMPLVLSSWFSLSTVMAPVSGGVLGPDWLEGTSIAISTAMLGPSDINLRRLFVLSDTDRIRTRPTSMPAVTAMDCRSPSCLASSNSAAV
jgi:hypothetical protein